ncbi:hypothetical protein ElyMa_002126000 [Elysia marginata]|uniref:Uncharacterized protein n=1 Tax=Elysia marginata TaxID=1093978 RepID=A0AAV4FI50_9GAST|nr:hypothetical protein ElyMa_002126000 [Elysia marginata]
MADGLTGLVSQLSAVKPRATYRCYYVIRFRLRRAKFPNVIRGGRLSGYWVNTSHILKAGERRPEVQAFVQSQHELTLCLNYPKVSAYRNFETYR